MFSFLLNSPAATGSAAHRHVNTVIAMRFIRSLLGLVGRRSTPQYERNRWRTIARGRSRRRDQRVATQVMPVMGRRAAMSRAESDGVACGHECMTENPEPFVGRRGLDLAGSLDESGTRPIRRCEEFYPRALG